MAIRGVNETTLFFGCPQCNELREIPLDALLVHARAGDRPHWALILPVCSCGARTNIVPGVTQEDSRNHIRRCAWKRAQGKAQFFNEGSAEVVAKLTAEIDAFYAQPGREALLAQYEDPTATVEVVTRAKE